MTEDNSDSICIVLTGSNYHAKYTRTGSLASSFAFGDSVARLGLELELDGPGPSPVSISTSESSLFCFCFGGDDFADIFSFFGERADFRVPDSGVTSSSEDSMIA
jgi:hypothetical protein